MGALYRLERTGGAFTEDEIRLLGSIGTAQWLVLCRHRHHSGWWIHGGFNWSSQHLNAEVREWDDHHAGLPRGRDGRRCVRRVDRQWRDESISSGSGQRSPGE